MNADVLNGDGTSPLPATGHTLAGWWFGSSMSIAPCNKVREVARRRTMMYDDGGMNDETSATV